MLWYILIPLLIIITLACIFWQYTFLIFYLIATGISNYKARFHSNEGIYKCSEIIELSNGDVIEELYFDFVRIEDSEYTKHINQNKRDEIYLGMNSIDKNGYYIVKAYLKFSGDEEPKEYLIKTRHNNPKERTIEIYIPNLKKTINIVWTYQDYEFVSSKKYKRVLKSINIDYLTIIGDSVDKNGNHEYEYIEKRFKLEYQGEIE